jgi:hypothetical protein
VALKYGYYFLIALIFYHWDIETVTSHSKLLLNRGGHMIMFDNIPVYALKWEASMAVVVLLLNLHTYTITAYQD